MKKNNIASVFHHILSISSCCKRTIFWILCNQQRTIFTTLPLASLTNLLAANGTSLSELAPAEGADELLSQFCRNVNRLTLDRDMTFHKKKEKESNALKHVARFLLVCHTPIFEANRVLNYKAISVQFLIMEVIYFECWVHNYQY